MSRAFVSEGDGWAFCTEKMRACMFASDRGTCFLPACKMEDSEKGRQEGEAPKDAEEAGAAGSGYLDKQIE